MPERARGVNNLRLGSQGLASTVPVCQSVNPRAFSPATIRNYLLYCRKFAAFFMRSPEQLGAAEVRTLTSGRRSHDETESFGAGVPKKHAGFTASWKRAETSRPTSSR